MINQSFADVNIFTKSFTLLILRKRKEFMTSSWHSSEHLAKSATVKRLILTWGNKKG